MELLYVKKSLSLLLILFLVSCSNDIKYEIMKKEIKKDYDIYYVHISSKQTKNKEPSTIYSKLKKKICNRSCEIVFSPEKYALGTAGPLSILENMDEDILVTNGDVITDMDYLAFFRSHLESNADITIARYNIHHQVNYGLLKVDDSNGKE